jgi:hypothetical protein
MAFKSMNGREEELSKITIKLYDTGSDHVFLNNGYWSFTGNKKPTLIEFHKDYSISSNISVFVDEFIFDKAVRRDTSSLKIAWLFESRGIVPNVYARVIQERKRIENFDMFATHDVKLASMFSNGAFVPVGGSWLSEDEIFISPKTKLTSMIASEKRLTPGHQLRHKVIKEFEGKKTIEFWGKSVGRDFSSKTQPLGEYMYSVCIMNMSYDCYFTEILTDCFLQRTIPIFWGTDAVRNIFDERGFYTWKNISELNSILSSLDERDYKSKLAFVEKNFEIALSLAESDLNLRRAIKDRFKI